MEWVLSNISKLPDLSDLCKVVWDQVLQRFLLEATLNQGVAAIEVRLPGGQPGLEAAAATPGDISGAKLGSVAVDSHVGSQ